MNERPHPLNCASWVCVRPWLLRVLRISVPSSAMLRMVVIGNPIHANTIFFVMFSLIYAFAIIKVNNGVFIANA